MPQSPKSFVLLLHVLSDDQHWDLMFDFGTSLATWQLAADPRLLAEKTGLSAISAHRLPDHRRAYLEYEGPISGNRGHVQRVDAGRYTLLECQDNRWVLELDGRHLHGKYEISTTRESDNWVLTHGKC